MNMNVQCPSLVSKQ